MRVEDRVRVLDDWVDGLEARLRQFEREPIAPVARQQGFVPAPPPPRFADGWPAALAVAHLAGGLAALRSRRASEALALTVLAIATLLGDLAFGALVSGLPLVLGWAASAVGFGALMRRAVPGSTHASWPRPAWAATSRWRSVTR
jgi:hypothetical protein